VKEQVDVFERTSEIQMQGDPGIAAKHAPGNALVYDQ